MHPCTTAKPKKVASGCPIVNFSFIVTETPLLCICNFLKQRLHSKIPPSWQLQRSPSHPWASIQEKIPPPYQSDSLSEKIHKLLKLHTSCFRYFEETWKRYPVNKISCLFGRTEFLTAKMSRFTLCGHFTWHSCVDLLHESFKCPLNVHLVHNMEKKCTKTPACFHSPLT